MSVPAAPVSRRTALKSFAAGVTALAAGCKPALEIVPHRVLPPGMTPGKPRLFATSLPLGGAGRGVLVESHEGRPTKVHGNPDHPCSLGSTDAFAEAEIVSLFDPGRSRTVRHHGLPAAWSALEGALAALPADGAGVALLTGRVGSPTAARQLRELISARPGLALFIDHGPALALEMFAGSPRATQLWPDFERLDTVVTLGADPLGPGPAQVALGRGWSAARRARPDRFRTYAFESTPSLTGLHADYRERTTPDAMSEILSVLEHADGDGLAARAARRLHRTAGRCAVLPGPTLTADEQARVATLNETLNAPLRYLQPFSSWQGLAFGDVCAMLGRIDAGGIHTVIVIDANPVYAHGDRFARAFKRVPARFHFGTRIDETAQAAHWHGPLNHGLEDWSDLRGVDGSAGLVQPLIAPLHDSRSVHELLARLARGIASDAREIVRETWRAAWNTPDDEAFERRWRASLHDGVIAASAAVDSTRDGGHDATPAHVGRHAPEETAAACVQAQAGPEPVDDARLGRRMRLLVRHAMIHDDRHASNAWLQECPDPLTKQVWGNALWISPEDAQALGIADEALVEVASGERSVHIAALIVPQQASGTVAMARGYGRTAAGPIGTNVGSAAAGLADTVLVSKAAGRATVIRLQTTFDQHGRDLLETVPSASAMLVDDGSPVTFYARKPDPGPSWGMVIDTDACTGCNACMIACQAENNIPVVGPVEAARGRRMHWLRIDTYHLPHGGAGFQPVPCMHCERAPCEPVCPVAASVHDSEGLNLQVYNRCIGTRFCQANCPYQVRRFNFFDYADGQAYADQGAELLSALKNPDVSVRGRGVMEKCTYCVQRISAARREAAKSDRPIAAAEVVTACQEACPTRAISFGDLSDPDSEVSRARRGPRHYALLAELGTLPRTTYLARIEPADGADG